MTSSSLIDALASATGTLAQRDQGLIEHACERALTGGQHGVLVVRDPLGRVLKADPDPQVPYGAIHVALLDHGTNLPDSPPEPS